MLQRRQAQMAAPPRHLSVQASAWNEHKLWKVSRRNESSSSSSDSSLDEENKGWGPSLSLPRAIFPWDNRYLAWSGVATALAAVTGFLIPWEVAFLPTAELYSLGSPWAALNLLLVGCFGLDTLISSRLAFFEGEVLVDSPPAMARHYLKSDFWADLFGFIPADWMLLAAVTAFSGTSGEAAGTLEWLPLLRLMHLARLYRVRNLFGFLEYNLQVSLLQVTIIRNLSIVLLITHWTACGFFLACVHSGFSPDVLYGADGAFLASLSPPDQYLYSLYWAVTTLSMVEANSLPSTMTQTVSAGLRSALFMLFNTALGSYIVGTITLLVVKADERTGNFRERSANLNQYTQTNHIPSELRESMQEHLRLHFDTENASDEQVLSIFPTTIRRRILKYLYASHLSSSYLFRKCPQRFLDALLASARVEVFMPGVDILSSGDPVGELFVLLSGTAEIIAPDPSAASAAQLAHQTAQQGGRVAQGMPSYHPDNVQAAAGELGPDSADVDNSLTQTFWSPGSPKPGGSKSPITKEVSGVRRPVAGGSVLGEAAFFTEVPQLEAVRSLTVCRVLVVGRAAYSSLERTFPNSSRRVLHNLKRKAENAVTSEFNGELKPAELDALWSHFSRLQFGWASAELQDDASSISLPSLDHQDLAEVANWSPRQQQVMSNLLRIRAVAQQYILRQEVERTTEFLWAASQGNEMKVRQMLHQGCPADAADYDGRTALELACVKGHQGVAEMLLAAGADANLQDHLGSCALLEACKHGHDGLVALLKRQGASLDGSKSSVEQAAVLCTAVFDGNLPLLRRLLTAGVSVDAGDYDQRTALHISAAEGNLQAVRLLVEEGGAGIEVRDRWGNTPNDEALRVAAGPVIRYFAGLDNHRAAPLVLETDTNQGNGSGSHQTSQ